MTTPHTYKLRPYHNPENVDESEVPDGWRFRYADETSQKENDAHYYITSEFPYGYQSVEYGRNLKTTYIVPVK